MNTRLQVEHRLTELRYGIDLVEWMIRQGSDTTAINLADVSLEPRGHAIECRIYAEDPLKNFKPTTGVLSQVILPKDKDGCHVDTWVYRGCPVSCSYDPLLANIVRWGPTRAEVTKSMVHTLQDATIAGPTNNLDYVTNFLLSDSFIKGKTDLDVLSSFVYNSRRMEVISPGLLTTVQDWPGRQGRGLWRIGVPPSGPMDNLACRIANTLVNNQESDAVLEITQRGPTLQFHCETSIALTGAAMECTLNGEPIYMWHRVPVIAGSILKVDSLSSTRGARAYLSVAGGLDVPEYLGSRSTFSNGNFGGHQGRPLRSGDVIPIGVPQSIRELSINGHRTGQDRIAIDATEVPIETKHQSFDATPIIEEYSEKWQIGVLPGPHANPEYFTDKDMEMFYSTEWQVHHNSNRLGIRLSGPHPEWSRSDGGEGGSHPSNIHDCEYAIGTINFTGNMPVIIAQDGPSLGGFVCPCTIVQSELWKIGQVKAGDTIKFRKMTIREAVQARWKQNEFIKTLETPAQNLTAVHNLVCFPETRPVIQTLNGSDSRPGAEIRLAGDSYILVEYGAMVLDLNLRLRVHFLEQLLRERHAPGLEETAPGVRSLQIRYNPLILPLADLLTIVVKADSELGDISHLSITTRVLHLPMCFNYSGVDKAIQKYTKSVRSHAPYLPSNIAYIARNNGLTGQADVQEKVFSASYMCLGLGDVYLGACCAVPVNLLHHLVTTKYNPARTFTQEGTVGLGGSYMCIYPMESPGGYQLVGRTLPIWDTFGVSNPELFSKEKPWLLQMFDQIRFYPVSEPELDDMRNKFSVGKFTLEVESEVFSISKYNAFLRSIADEVEGYRQTQKEAATLMLQEEEKSLDKLKMEDEKQLNQHDGLSGEADLEMMPEDSMGVYSPVTGKVWDFTVSSGDSVDEDQVVASIEAMKMECTCTAPCPGIVTRILAKVGQFVHQGDLIIIIKID